MHLDDMLSTLPVLAGHTPRFGVSRMGAGLEGLNGRAYRSQRFETVRGVWDLAKGNGFALIKAPPQSGKTSLLQLVLNHAEAEGCVGHYFNCSLLIEGQGISGLDQLLDGTCGTLMKLMGEGESCRCKSTCLLHDQVYHALLLLAACGHRPMTVLALDEAQIIYNMEATLSKPFWTSLKRLQGNVDQFNVRVVLAAAYGAGGSSTGANSSPDSPTATPADIDTAATSVSIHPPQDGRVSLQLSPYEVRELWDEWKAVLARVNLDDTVKDQIAAMCSSQVGIFCSICHTECTGGSKMKSCFDNFILYRPRWA